MPLEAHDLAWGPDALTGILDDIRLCLEPGRFTIVIGPNGSGKSSLLRCLTRLVRPRAGRVTLDGRDLWSLTPRACAQRIAMVQQEFPAEFGLSVREVVAMGRTPYQSLFQRESSAEAALITAAIERLGLAHCADRVFECLSGGEKQRVLVARALVQEPEILVLDEPINHLDVRYQIDILRLLRRLGISVLATLHDLNLAAACADRLYVLHEGRIVAAGAPGEVLDAELIRRVFGIDARVEHHPDDGRPHILYSL